MVISRRMFGCWSGPGEAMTPLAPLDPVVDPGFGQGETPILVGANLLT